MLIIHLQLTEVICVLEQENIIHLNFQFMWTTEPIKVKFNILNTALKNHSELPCTIFYQVLKQFYMGGFTENKQVPLWFSLLSQSTTEV